jgi:hypothetical protein
MKSVRGLLDLFAGHTNVQGQALIAPYVGGVIDVDGTVGEVIDDSGENLAKVIVREHKDTLECRFAARWLDKLSSLNQGSAIKIACIVAPNQTGQMLYLDNCALR